jgi:DNA repair protein RadC
VLIAKFGSVSAVLAADAAVLGRVLGGRSDVAAFLAAIRAVMLRGLEHDAFDGPVLSTSQQLLDYLRADMAHAQVERFRVLFLNAQNRLLGETVAEGSVNQAPIYPREIVRRALDLGATALILVHNHPSGDPTPSASDIEATEQLAMAGRTFDICVHDHVVVARSGWFSFKATGLL